MNTNIVYKRYIEGNISLSVIVCLREFPNHNIAVLLNSTQRLSNIHEIIIVADSITNPSECKKMLFRTLNEDLKLASIKLVQVDLKKGGGLSYSRNIGVALSQAPNLLFIDDDAAVLDDVAPLVEYLDEGVCQGIQPLILRFDEDTIDSAGDFVKNEPIFYQVWVRHFNKPIASVINKLKTEEVPSLRGAFTLMRKESLLAVGGFDETFYYQWDDVDLGWRMTIAGFKLLFVPSVRALHKGGETTDPARCTREKTVKLEILNSTAVRLKITPLSAWPVIMKQFLKRLIFFEMTAMDRRKIDRNLHFMIKEFLEMSLLFAKRFTMVASHRRMLQWRTTAGLNRFRAMAKGEQFEFHLPIITTYQPLSNNSITFGPIAEEGIPIPV